MARLMRIALSLPIWEEMVVKGWKTEGMKCVEGLPEGAELVSSYYDGLKSTAYLIYHHPSFANLHEGAVIPIVDVAFKHAYSENDSE